MTYLSLTDADRDAMLDTIGVADIQDLCPRLRGALDALEAV